MAEDNGLKNIVKKYSKRLTRVFIAASLLVIIIAIIFLGAVSTIYEEVSDAFKDVLDNVEINGDNLEINQDYLSEAEKRLQNMGIDASTLGLNGHEEYLERFLEAEVVTNYPYLGGDGLQGTVYFERAKIDGSTTELQYIAYDEFYAMQEAGNSEVYNYFTIDTEDWTVHVVKNSSQNSFEIEKINYKNMVEKFSMPFEFTIALAMTSQNPQFALAVVNLVKDSRIVITIAESKTTTTINKTETYHLERIIRDLETDEETVIEDDIETRAEPDISESYYTTVFLSRANTWILNQITDFSYEDTGDVDGEPQVEELEGGSETVTTETSEITSTISNRKSTTIVTTRQQRWNQGQPKVIEKTSNFTNLILRDTNTISGQGLIGVAKTCHDYLSDNGYTYGFGSGHREFPNIESISSIDCSAYVSWVLYKAGYEDIGAQSSSSLINYANEKGWEIINSVNDLKPGDIIIYTEHTNILVAIEGDKYLCYDCGDTSAVQAKDPIEYNVNNGFQYALRPNDEIVQALEPQNINDLKEDVKEYLDNISTGEYQVTVKNLDKSSRNSFSIGSGKVKSEGWLKLFIMATAYNEVKNGDIEETAVSSDIDRMITTDSNDAANALLTTLGDGDIEEGIDKVNAYLDRQNYNGTNLEEQFPIEVGSAGSDDNYTTIANVSKLLQNIYKNKCVNKEYSEKMMEMLKRQLLIEYIPSVITEGEVANKTGEQMNILQDAAIVSIENANYLLVVSATDVTDKAEAGRRIADISRMVNAYFVENGSVNDNSDNFAQDDELDIIMNGRRVCYNVPNIGYQCPLDNLVDAHEMLFELLGSLEKTQNHENLMRYLLYLLTGDSYGVEEFNFEEFVNGSFSSSTGIYGNTIQEKVWFALRGLGYSEISVAGAMGNIHHESGGFNPAIVENGGSGEGIGLIQWSFGRRTALENYAASKGVSWQDEDTQIEFLITEISGQGAAIGYATQRTSGYILEEGITSTHEDWKNATSIEDATLYFMRYFESPKSKSSLSTRTEWAWTYYNEFKGRTAPTGSHEGWSTKGVSCPRYYQNDSRWKDNYYNTSGGTIGENGCGACALAMAVSGLTGQEVTPDVIVDYLNSLNLDTVYNGAASAQAVANKYGLTYERISRSDRTSINAALDAGKCCIFSINGNGIYIGAGHFIMCNGREGDQYYVLESGHYYQTDVGYTFNQVFSAGNQGVFVLGK